MTLRCLDCNLPIEGDPWWYNPSAVGLNVSQVTALTEIVSRRPDPPTAVSTPFHKACLERQMGRSLDS
jgi:hypothetical protein